MSERDGIKEKMAGEGRVAPTRTKRSMFAASGLGALLLVAGTSVGYAAFGRAGELAAELRDEAAAESPEGQDAPEKAVEEPSSFQDRPDAVDAEEGEEALGAIVPLDTFLLNLPGGKYIRVQMQLEFQSMDIPTRFYGRVVPIRDAIITLISNQKADDLQTTKGKDELKDNVRKIVNGQLRKELVRRVYFTQFVIQ
jgi:flagellar basal body-associated protein FliL